MFGKMKLKKKLILIGLIMSIGPLLLTSIFAIIQNNKILDIASEESKRLAKTDLDHILSGVYSMCKSQQELLQQTINNSLNVARKIITSHGDIILTEEEQEELRLMLEAKTETITLEEVKAMVYAVVRESTS